MLSALFAILRREPFTKGSLNGWNEALVFAAVSRLAHATAQIQGILSGRSRAESTMVTDHRFQ